MAEKGNARIGVARGESDLPDCDRVRPRSRRRTEVPRLGQLAVYVADGWDT